VFSDSIKYCDYVHLFLKNLERVYILSFIVSLADYDVQAVE